MAPAGQPTQAAGAGISFTQFLTYKFAPLSTRACVLTIARQLTEIERIKYARTVRRDHKQSNHVRRAAEAEIGKNGRRPLHWSEQKRAAC